MERVVNGWHVQSYARTERGTVPVEELTAEERAVLVKNIYRAVATITLPAGYQLRFPSEVEDARGTTHQRQESRSVHQGQYRDASA